MFCILPKKFPSQLSRDFSQTLNIIIKQLVWVSLFKMTANSLGKMKLANTLIFMQKNYWHPCLCRVFRKFMRMHITKKLCRNFKDFFSCTQINIFKFRFPYTAWSNSYYPLHSAKFNILNFLITAACWYIVENLYLCTCEWYWSILLTFWNISVWFWCKDRVDVSKWVDR